jgi:hypothetical protein
MNHDTFFTPEELYRDADMDLPEFAPKPTWQR